MMIADAIKQYRANQGLTQEDLAIKIGKSSRCIKRYEKGEIIPKIEVLESIFDKPIQVMLYDKLIKGE